MGVGIYIIPFTINILGTKEKFSGLMMFEMLSRARKDMGVSLNCKCNLKYF